MALASSCTYPDGYFRDLSRNADEDLEIERNDVRDILRSATSLEHSFSESSSSIKILDNLIGACSSAVDLSSDRIPPEIAVHTLSALAKPVNKLADSLLKGAGEKSIRVVQNALQTLAQTCEKLLHNFSSSSIADLLPVSRLASLAIASFSPAFSAVCTLRNTEGMSTSVHALIAVMERALSMAIHFTERAILVIPELISVSTLDETQYDIIGGKIRFVRSRASIDLLLKTVQLYVFEITLSLSYESTRGRRSLFEHRSDEIVF